jgi:hypothetical protein
VGEQTRIDSQLAKGQALIADIDRVTLARDRVLVDLIVHDDTQRAARKVVGAAGADQGEAAWEGL